MQKGSRTVDNLIKGQTWNPLLSHNPCPFPTVQKRGTNMLFVIGGNGSHAGALAIHEECFKRKLKVAVVGVVSYIRRGFWTPEYLKGSGSSPDGMTRPQAWPPDETQEVACSSSQCADLNGKRPLLRPTACN